jgi:hypothetical protein
MSCKRTFKVTDPTCDGYGASVGEPLCDTLNPRLTFKFYYLHKKLFPLSLLFPDNRRRTNHHHGGVVCPSSGVDLINPLNQTHERPPEDFCGGRCSPGVARS